MEKFYADVFGWSFTHMGEKYGDYRVIRTGPSPDEPMSSGEFGINGGLTPRAERDLPAKDAAVNAFVNVIGVEDAAAMVEKITAAGGTIATGLMDVPGVGKLAYCKDPEGNLFGVLTPLAM